MNDHAKPRLNPVLAIGQAPRSDSPGRFATPNTVPQDLARRVQAPSATILRPAFGKRRCAGDAGAPRSDKRITT